MSYAYSNVWPGGGTWTRRAAIDRLDRLSRLLDVAFVIPGTGIRFGVEALLRAIPGIGDVAASKRLPPREPPREVSWRRVPEKREA
jgi:hypothetical protein